MSKGKLHRKGGAQSHGPTVDDHYGSRVAARLSSDLWQGRFVFDQKEVRGLDLFSSTIMLTLQKQLDASALTQRVIANNIANINTPGFKKSQVSFASELRQALGEDALPLKTDDPRQIGAPVPLNQLEPAVNQITDTTMGYNQNNVDIDQEMVNLAANTLTYQAAAQLLGGKFSSLDYVIKGR